MYADIIIDISHEQLDKTFQYAIPEELDGTVEIGSVVRVPFGKGNRMITCLLYTSPSPRDSVLSRMPSSA